VNPHGLGRDEFVDVDIDSANDFHDNLSQQFWVECRDTVANRVNEILVTVFVDNWGGLQ